MEDYLESSNENKKLNKIKIKDILENIKSKYIYQKIFTYLHKKKKLDISKYNKKIKKSIDISINDYKNYTEIEIEIIPVYNNKYTKFININKEEEKYYHIFFNNNKEEIKRNYLNENEQVKRINIIIDYQVKSFKGLFQDCINIRSIYFKKFNRNNITDMNSMFYNCLSLKELNLSNFNTKNVTNMNSMFCECSSLNELNLSNFNTNKVTNMNYMFFGCKSLNELNLSSFNTDNVINIWAMFYGCSKVFIRKIRAQYKNIKNEAFIKQ